MSKKKDYLDLVSTMDWSGRKHADGSVCKAESAESCPFEKKAEKADAEVSKTMPDGLPDYSGKTKQEIEDALFDTDLGLGEVSEEYVKYCAGEVAKNPNEYLWGDTFEDSIQDLSERIKDGEREWRREQGEIAESVKYGEGV